MRKSFIKISAITLLSLSLINPVTAQAKVSNYRTINAIVTEVKDGNVLFSTEDGNGWYLENVKGYKVNQRYKIKYDTIGTESIYDDEIIKVTKIKE